MTDIINLTDLYDSTSHWADQPILRMELSEDDNSTILCDCYRDEVAVWHLNGVTTPAYLKQVRLQICKPIDLSLLERITLCINSSLRHSLNGSLIFSSCMKSSTKLCKKIIFSSLTDLKQLASLYSEEKYLLGINLQTGNIHIILRKDSNIVEQLRSAFQAEVINVLAEKYKVSSNVRLLCH